MISHSIKLWLGITFTAAGFLFWCFGFNFIAMHSTYEEICDYDGTVDSCDEAKAYEKDYVWARTDFKYDWQVKAQELRRDAEQQKCAIEDNLQKSLQKWERDQADAFLKQCQDEYRNCLSVTTTTTTTNSDCTLCNRYCNSYNWLEDHQKFAEMMGLSTGAAHTCGWEFSQVLEKPAGSSPTCDEHSWSDQKTIDAGASCGDCEVVVNDFNETFKSCVAYCQAQGRSCVRGWKYVDDQCTRGSPIATCGTELPLDKYAICECGTIDRTEDIVPLLGKLNEECKDTCSNHPERFECNNDVMESWNFSMWNKSFMQAAWNSGYRAAWDTFRQDEEKGSCVLQNETSASLGNPFTWKGLYVGPSPTNKADWCKWYATPCTGFTHPSVAGICACQRKEYYLERFTVNNNHMPLCQSGHLITQGTYVNSGYPAGDNARAEYECRRAAEKIGVPFWGPLNVTAGAEKGQLPGCILNQNGTDYTFNKGFGVYYQNPTYTLSDYDGVPVPNRNVICKGACPNFEDAQACPGLFIPDDQKHRRESCSYLLPDNTIRWIDNAEPSEKPYGKTCASWCAGKGMTCVGMYEPGSGSCNILKSGDLGCNYEGTLSDPANSAKVICQCKRQACPWKPECGVGDLVHQKCTSMGCSCNKPSCTSTSTTTTTTPAVMEYCGPPNGQPSGTPSEVCECAPYMVTTENECTAAHDYFHQLGMSYVTMDSTPSADATEVTGCGFQGITDALDPIIAQLNMNEPPPSPSPAGAWPEPALATTLSGVKLGRICTTKTSLTCDAWGANKTICGDTSTSGTGDNPAPLSNGGSGKRRTFAGLTQEQCLNWCQAQGAGCCQYFSKQPGCVWKQYGVVRDIDLSLSLFQRTALDPYILQATICKGCDSYRQWCDQEIIGCEHSGTSYSCVAKRKCEVDATTKYDCDSGSMRPDPTNIDCFDGTCSKRAENEALCCLPFATCGAYTSGMCPTGQVIDNQNSVLASDAVGDDTAANDLKCCKGLAKCSAFKHEYCEESRPEFGLRGSELRTNAAVVDCADWNCASSNPANVEKCCVPKKTECNLGYQFTAAGIELTSSWTWGPGIDAPLAGDMVINSDLDLLMTELHNTTYMIKNGTIECIPACTCAAGVAGVAMVGPPLKLWWNHLYSDAMLDNPSVAGTLQGVTVKHNESILQNVTLSKNCRSYLSDRSNYMMKWNGVALQPGFQACVAAGFTEQYCFDSYEIPDVGCGYTGQLRINCAVYRGYRSGQRSFYSCGLKQDITDCKPPTYETAIAECYDIPTPPPYESRSIGDWLEVEELDVHALAPNPPDFAMPDRPTREPRKCCEVYVGPTCEKNRIELDRQVTGFMPNMEITVTWNDTTVDPPEIKTWSGPKTKSQNPLVRPESSRRRRHLEQHSSRPPCSDFPSGNSCLSGIVWPAGLIELAGAVSISGSAIPVGANLTGILRSGQTGSYKSCFCTCHPGYKVHNNADCRKGSGDPIQPCCPDIVMNSHTTREIENGQYYIFLDDIHDGAGEWDPKETWHKDGYFPTKPCDEQVPFLNKSCPRIKINYKKQFNWGYSSEPPFPECAHVCNKAKAEAFVRDFCNTTKTAPYNQTKVEFDAFEEKKRIMQEGRSSLLSWTRENQVFVSETVKVFDCTSPPEKSNDANWVDARIYGGSLGAPVHKNDNMGKLKLNKWCRLKNCKHNQCLKVKTPCDMDTTSSDVYQLMFANTAENTCPVDTSWATYDTNSYECVDKITAMGNNPMGLGFGITFCILAILLIPTGCVITYTALQEYDNKVHVFEKKMMEVQQAPGPASPAFSSPTPLRLAAHPDPKMQAMKDEGLPPHTVMEEEAC